MRGYWAADSQRRRIDLEHTWVDGLLTASCIGAVEFTPAYFRRRPSRLLKGAFAAVFLLATPMVAGPFGGIRS